MRTLVVYESMYGNTEHVARAIAEGIADAELVEVGLAPTKLPPEVALLVVGGPTHAHGMTREGTRRDAGTRVDRPIVSPGIGIREWIDAVQPSDVIVAAFDTRIRGPQILTGSAARSATEQLRKRGFKTVPPESFVLARIGGEPFDQVSEAELDRARGWGRSLSTLLPVAAG